MKTIILAGGAGTRITEESQFHPKPMTEIGGMPILWHIMKLYGSYGFHEFIVCAGYKQEYVKRWFAEYSLRTSDVTFDLETGEIEIHRRRAEPWKVTVVDTGVATSTGGRIKRVQSYVGKETFMMTYGDGVCDVNIADLVQFHRAHGKLATLTAVIQRQSKGILEIGELGSVKSFREKSLMDGAAINAGFMVLEPEVFDYLDGDETIFETTPLERLAQRGELMSYRHTGFWQCMDTIREKMLLERLWETGNAPWKVWED